MKTIWCDVDVRPGRIVTTKTINHNHMISYRVAVDGNIYGLIDLRDGMNCEIGSKTEVAAALNKDGFFPIELQDK